MIVPLFGTPMRGIQWEVGWLVWLAFKMQHVAIYIYQCTDYFS